MSFGEQLRKRREELGISRAELADRLGVSRSAIGNYETGVSAPKEEVLLRLFDALGVDPNYLYRDAYRANGGIRSDEEQALLESYRRLSLAGRQTVHTMVRALEGMQQELEQAQPQQAAPAAAPAASTPVNKKENGFWGNTITVINNFANTVLNLTLKDVKIDVSHTGTENYINPEAGKAALSVQGAVSYTHLTLPTT